METENSKDFNLIFFVSVTHSWPSGAPASFGHCYKNNKPMEKQLLPEDYYDSKTKDKYNLWTLHVHSEYNLKF